MPIWKTK